jgi:hypothetical protein
LRRLRPPLFWGTRARGFPAGELEEGKKGILFQFLPEELEGKKIPGNPGTLPIF